MLVGGIGGEAVALFELFELLVAFFAANLAATVVDPRFHGKLIAERAEEEWPTGTEGDETNTGGVTFDDS
jgi:hypothetical protein